MLDVNATVYSVKCKAGLKSFMDVNKVQDSLSFPS